MLVLCLHLVLIFFNSLQFTPWNVFGWEDLERKIYLCIDLQPRRLSESQLMSQFNQFYSISALVSPHPSQRHQVGGWGGGGGQLRHGCWDGGQAGPLLTPAGRTEAVEVDVDGREDVGGSEAGPGLHQTVKVEADATAGSVDTDALDIP